MWIAIIFLIFTIGFWLLPESVVIKLVEIIDL